VGKVSGVISSIVEASRYRGVRILWCQSIGVRCKDMGMVVGEFQLLLDFKTLRL
jgi:hypothetical protein